MSSPKKVPLAFHWNCKGYAGINQALTEEGELVVVLLKRCEKRVSFNPPKLKKLFPPGSMRGTARVHF